MSDITRRQSNNLYLQGAEKAAKKKQPISASEIHRRQVAAAARAVNSSSKRYHLSYREASQHYSVSVGSIQHAVARLRSGGDPKPEAAGGSTALSASVCRHPA